MNRDISYICKDLYINSESYVTNAELSNYLRSSNANVNPAELRAAMLTTKKWPANTVLNVVFLGGQSWQKAWVEKVIKEQFEPYCAVKFSFDPNGQRTIRISFNEAEGAYSALGTDALVMDINKATMNLGWLDAPGTKTDQGRFTWKGIEYKVPAGQPRNKNEVGATVMHEFGHAVALIHEHQNPRGAGIQWNFDKVYQQFSGAPNNWSRDTIYNNILKKYAEDQTQGSMYDPKSIMLYFFSGDLTTDNKGTDMNYVLSPLDKQWLAQAVAGDTSPTSTGSTNFSTQQSEKNNYSSTIINNMSDTTRIVPNANANNSSPSYVIYPSSSPAPSQGMLAAPYGAPIPISISLASDGSTSGTGGRRGRGSGSCRSRSRSRRRRRSDDDDCDTDDTDSDSDDDDSSKRSRRRRRRRGRDQTRHQAPIIIPLPSDDSDNYNNYCPPPHPPPMMYYPPPPPPPQPQIIPFPMPMMQHQQPQQQCCMPPPRKRSRSPRKRTPCPPHPPCPPRPPCPACPRCPPPPRPKPPPPRPPPKPPIRRPPPPIRRPPPVIKRRVCNQQYVGCRGRADVGHKHGAVGHMSWGAGAAPGQYRAAGGGMSANAYDPPPRPAGVSGDTIIRENFGDDMTGDPNSSSNNNNAFKVLGVVIAIMIMIAIIYYLRNKAEE
jgi:hypothetical protein